MSGFMTNGGLHDFGRLTTKKQEKKTYLQAEKRVGSSVVLKHWGGRERKRERGNKLEAELVIIVASQGSKRVYVLAFKQSQACSYSIVQAEEDGA